MIETKEKRGGEKKMEKNTPQTILYSYINSNSLFSFNGDNYLKLDYEDALDIDCLINKRFSGDEEVTPWPKGASFTLKVTQD
mgnify:CR=1 FL=1